MVRYSDELIDEIRSKNDIVDIISQYVVLKRSGRNFFGLCPFHKEKSPSFSVSPDKQIFHCFGCGVGGNVFHFVEKIENLGFIESLEMLADRAGINLPTISNSVDDKLLKLKSKVYDINAETAKFYHENLYKPTSKEAQNYIKKRKLDNRTLKNFLIGYSGNFNELYVHLKSKGFTDEEILTSGLVNKNDNGKFIDRFRRRLMFPIQDTRNRVIAFGGRVLDDSKPKYINSSENIVYSKGKHLFGLNVAKKEHLKKIIIVEGYMDAISLHQRGITNAVASLGTALTESQGRLLRKSSEQVIIGYDADGAGQAATVRGLEILQNLGCDIRILQIEGAKDPDEFVTKYGPERFLKYVDNAISLVEYKIKVLKQKLDINNTNDKIKFLKEIAKELAKISNNIEREVYVDKISLEYNISKEAIYSEINKLIYGKNEDEKRINVTKVVQPQKKVIEETDKAVAKREGLIIYLLINYPNEAYSKIKEVVSVEDIKSERNKKVITKLYEELEKGYSNINNVLDWFQEEEIINYLTSIMAYDFEITEVNKCIEDILNIYIKEKLIKKRNDIINKLENKELDKEDKANYEKQLSEIIVKLAKVK
ncbi:MAG: DNA primase [Clostridia bacterium]|jgi:DNA primase|nr:dNA primase [Clostridium sp. CAG:571]